MLHLLIYSYSRARYARSLRMLIFTFRLHGLIEVTPCGNIAGAMALNRGARPISPLSFCLHDNRSCTLFLSMFPILFFFPYFASTVSLSPIFFSPLLFLSLYHSLHVNSMSLTGRYFAYLPHCCALPVLATGWHCSRCREINPAPFFFHN